MKGNRPAWSVEDELRYLDMDPESEPDEETKRSFGLYLMFGFDEVD